MLSRISRIIHGEPGSREGKQFAPVVKRINALEDTYKPKTDTQLKEDIASFKERLASGEVFTKLLPDIFAVVREVAKRTVGMRHYDVQLLGGLVLAHDSIAEMRTGEGKTLVATLPVVARALEGRGAHVVTVNDYLAKRDAAWMGQVYSALGLSVGVITSTGAYVYDPGHADIDALRDEFGYFKIYEDFLHPASKKEAYDADITYGTNNEFGFDYLRDNTAFSKEQRVARERHYALVDEVDSILIDEARTPLIISSPFTDSDRLYEKFAMVAKGLIEGVDYTIDEKQRAVQITDSGIEKAERALGVDNLYVAGGVKYAHYLENAVRARALFHKDKEYVVKDGEVVIVDEFTGRLQPGRRWSEGLHQSVEAKEGVRIQEESRTLASITFQNYFRLYKHLSGMTGTGYSSREEFYTVYGLDVVPIPTHKPSRRIDNEDLIFQTVRGKYTALTRKVAELHKKGQPVLIGTVSIDDNEVVSSYLTKARIPHEVLNAKNHEREGEIIAGAGHKGHVTVATNMAGRGVDIKLGGDAATPEERDEVLALGGLHVIGTERHEARRIDDQLRGRSGRQGDPGETQFYVSLEDKLMRVFAAESMKRMMGRLGMREDEPIQNKLITRSLESAQKKIEGFNFDARKQVLAYDDVLNHQRQLFYERRNLVLESDADGLEAFVREQIAGNTAVEEVLQQKEELFGKEKLYLGLRVLLLQLLDTLWLDHLETMEYLRRSVSLRAYGQRDPLVEYRKEGLAKFAALEQEVKTQIQALLPHLEEKTEHPEAVPTQQVIEESGGSEHSTTSTVTQAHSYGRNEMVTVTNGTETKEMKFKKAEKLLAQGWSIVHT